MTIAPYIGVTGFMQREEVEAVLQVFPENSPRKLMVGVLASSKTLSGQRNKYPERYPPIERIGDILIDDPRIINLIHYNTKDTNDLDRQLARMVEIAGPNLQGFQLNIPWPEIPPLQSFREKHPEKKIVLQIGQQAMEGVDNEPWWIADTIKEYAKNGVIDGILLDSSGGKGIPADFSFYLRCLRELGSCNVIGLGVAGGLAARTLWKIRQTFLFFPGISIDGEGGFRDSQDRLDTKEAIAYLNEAHTLFAEWEKHRQHLKKL